MSLFLSMGHVFSFVHRLNIEGKPDIPKFVMIAAPHTSNWDLPIMLACGFLTRAKLFWMTMTLSLSDLWYLPLAWRHSDRSQKYGVVGCALKCFPNTMNHSCGSSRRHTQESTCMETAFTTLPSAQSAIALGYLITNAAAVVLAVCSIHRRLRQGHQGIQAFQCMSLEVS